MARAHPDFPWMKVYELDYGVLRRVLQWMMERGEVMDGDSVGYNVPEGANYPCTSEEYHDLHTALEQEFDLGEHAEIDDEDGVFPQWEQHFLFEGHAFSWWMMTGQGTACQFAPAGCSRTPFVVEDCIVISADGQHVVPEERRRPVGKSSKEPDETLLYTDDEDQLLGGLNKLLAGHGLEMTCRSCRRDGGLYVRLRKKEG